MVAFQPFLEALGHYIVQAPLDELRATTRAHGAELARLVPELRRRLPELPATDDGDSETGRYRLFEAVVGLLGDLSESSSVLIVIDDLHWADRPTLMLLRHLARSPRPGRLSIVGAYRSTERWSEGFSAALANAAPRAVAEADRAGRPARARCGAAGRAAGRPGAGGRRFARAVRRDRGQPVLHRGDPQPPAGLGGRGAQRGGLRPAAVRSSRRRSRGDLTEARAPRSEHGRNDARRVGDRA